MGSGADRDDCIHGYDPVHCRECEREREARKRATYERIMKLNKVELLTILDNNLSKEGLAYLLIDRFYYVL